MDGNQIELTTTQNPQIDEAQKVNQLFGIEVFKTKKNKENKDGISK